MKANLVGIPLDLGAKNLGVDVGPDAFRYQKLVEKLEGAGIKIADHDNIKVGKREDLKPGNKRLRYLDEIVRVSEETAQLTEDIVKKGEKVIALGGDHSVNLGVVAGASVAAN